MNPAAWIIGWSIACAGAVWLRIELQLRRQSNGSAQAAVREAERILRRARRSVPSDSK